MKTFILFKLAPRSLYRALALLVYLLLNSVILGCVHPRM